MATFRTYMSCKGVPPITPEMIENGEVYLESYAMKRHPDGDTLASASEEPDYYDLNLRPDDHEKTDGMNFEEHEYLTLDELNEEIEAYQKRYPGIAVGETVEAC